MQTLRPSLLRLPRATSTCLRIQKQHRTFLPNPFTNLSSPLAALNQEPAVLTATRTLPYAHTDLFNVIADVPAYSEFLPYCQSSTVTSWSAPDTEGRRWPSEARLVVGFGGLSEGFVSRVLCAPPTAGGEEVGIVEAVSGNTQSTLRGESVAHHVTPTEGTKRPQEEGESELLTHMLTRWTLRGFKFKPAPTPTSNSTSPLKTETTPVPQTECTLSIEYAFANPIYGAMTGAAASGVAERMIKAFESRVRDVLGEPANGGQTGPGRGGTGERGSMEGVV